MKTFTKILLSTAAAIFASQTMAEAPYARIEDSIKNAMINSGACKSLKDCAQNNYIYSEHGNGVYLSFYKITKKHQIAAIASTAVSETLSQQEKIPLTLDFYEKDHKEYTNLNSFFKKPFTSIKVE